MQHIRGYSAFQTGLAFLPVTLAIGLMSAGVAARLMARIGPRNLLMAGLAIVISALAILADAGPATSYAPDLAIAYILLGAGAGSSFLPLLTITMADVPMADAGLASGFSNVTMQVGGALGLAAIGSVSTSVASGTAGFQLAYVLAAICVASSLALVALVLRGAAPAPVRHGAEVEAEQAA